MGACLATVVALGVGCAPKSSDTDDWGYMMIQLLRAANQAESPFIGTHRIRALVSYDEGYSECLVDFYRGNPNWMADGVDGGPIFDEWKTRVCEAQAHCEYEPIPCGSVVILQRGLEEGETPALDITYAVPEGKDDEIENRVLIMGPLPLPEMLDCEEGAPTMSIHAPDITGQGSEDNPIWQGTSTPEDKATGATGRQCEPMKVRVARL